MRKRIYSIIAVLLILSFTFAAGMKAEDNSEPVLTKDSQLQSKLLSVSENEVPETTVGDTGFGKKTVLRIWYTEEGMSPYIEQQAAKYMQEHEDIHILPVLVPQAEYLERIYDESVGKGEQTGMPDLYLTTSDTLEKACLSGIATTILDNDQQVGEEKFPLAALNAVTYKGKKVAYPLYYETAFFLYNRTYLEQMAKAHNDQLQDLQEGMAAQEAADAMETEGQAPADGEVYVEGPEESVKLTEVSADDLIPRKIEDILNLANDYDAPEGMENIFKWDVTDVFYNYFFAGSTINVGGECGDDRSLVNINNSDTIAAMEVYQALRQFFSIEAKDSDYETILREFREGKTLFTIASTDVIAKLKAAKDAGEFQAEYGITHMPDLNSTLTSRGLSVTTVVAINGFGEKQQEADDFAAFLTCNGDAGLYEMTGHPSASYMADYEDEKLKKAMSVYEKSIGLPKIMEASNFWMQLEITMTGIWEGDDITEAVEKLQQQMDSQVN
ncbi:MAG: extracellular solute-binding protein [Lachnospiraceae bacterium]|nr:extracellular solute-binding protein [Lachnospiraceae bacterium]